MRGPSWLGIGAQRSGTDWVSRLLIQHPQLDFGTNGKKEQAYLHKIPNKKLTEEGYLELFPSDDRRRGEWSPHYMPSMIVPHIAARVVQDDAPIFVLMRDPVERLASSMRLAKQFKRIPNDFHEPWIARAHQYGQYASCLEGWTAAIARERFVLLTYEEAREDVQKVCELFWDAIGVRPHQLADPYKVVKQPTEGKIDWEWPEGTRAALVKHYLPQVLWLRDHWGVDVSRWKNFEGLLD